MANAQLRSRLDWGDLSLVLLFAAVTIAYLADAWAASGSLRNLVLLVPVSILSLVLCALVVVDIVRRAGAAPEGVAQEESSEPGQRSLIDRFKPVALMALFALYVLTLPWLGFDVGSAVFVAAALVMDGERRLWLIAPVSIAFALGATLLFRWLLPYPMPTLVV